MKKKIDIYFTVLVFLLFLIICFCSPLMGDDWGNHINGSGGLLYTIRYAFHSYTSYEGRIVSRIFLTILTYHKIWWNILNPLIISMIYYLILKITQHKDKYITPTLVFLAFLLVDEEAFRQVYVWVAGNMTYVPPMITLFLIMYLNKNLKYKPSKAMMIILPILTLITSIFVENLTTCLIVELFIFLLYYFIKNKKVYISLLISFLSSISGLLIMVLSPGTSNRLDTYPEFSKLNIFNKVLYNVPNFINFTFIRNSFLVLLISSCIIYLVSKYFKKYKFKYLIYMYMSVVPFLTASLNYLKTFGIYFPKLDCLFNYNGWYTIVFWSGYIIIILLVLFKYFKDTKDYISVFLILIGIISNLSMMVAPVWGGRTSFITTICLSVAFINIISKFKFIEKNNKITGLIFGTGLFVFIVFFIWGYSNIYKTNQLREQYIKEQVKEDSEEIEIIVLSERFLWNPNPWDPKGYLARTFKQYYHIDDNKQIKLIFLDDDK